MAFIPYKQIVDYFQTACTEHKYIQSFAHGTLDYLDASSQNVVYPYVFLRPVASPGYDQTTKYRQLLFELYALDVPKLSNESPVDVMSRMETVIYDLGSYFDWGPPSDQAINDYSFDIQSLTPVNEAFNDRAYGWVANTQITTLGLFNYCNYPS